MKQKGFINAQLAVGVLVMSSLAVTYATLSRNDSLDKLAYSSGKEAGQVNNAVRAYISRNSDTINNGDRKSGLKWLKSRTECGGSAQADFSYLPCDFPEKLPLGLAYDNIRFKKDASGSISSEMILGIPNDSVEDIPYLSGQIVSGAKGVSTLNADPDFGGRVYFDARDDGNGQVTLTASNAAGSDLYLRADGSVKPTDNFDWNGKSLSNISKIQSNTVEANSMKAGEVESEVVRTNTIYAKDSSPSIAGVMSMSGRSRSSSIESSSTPEKKIDLLGTSVISGLEVDRTVIKRHVPENSSCYTFGEIAIDQSNGNLLSCNGAKWVSGNSSGKVLTSTGRYTGRCSTMVSPPGTSASTHDLAYKYYILNQCNFESSHHNHGAGYIESGNSKNICGSTYCTDNGWSGGSWLIIATPK